MLVKNLLIGLLALILLLSFLSGCGSISIPNLEVCSVDGKLSNGLYCEETLTDNSRDLNLEETIKLLEADEETGKGAALIMSSIHWTKLKTSLEKACKSLGDNCHKELKKTVNKMNAFEKRVKNDGWFMR